MISENIESFRHLLYNTRHRNSKENSRFEDINRGDDNIICSRLFLLYWLFSKSNRKLFLNFLDEFEYIYLYVYKSSIMILYCVNILWIWCILFRCMQQRVDDT